jgi:hypothetical protein
VLVGAGPILVPIRQIYNIGHKGWPRMHDSLSIQLLSWLKADGPFSERFILFEKGSWHILAHATARR